MVPCQRKTRTQGRNGRAHQALTPVQPVTCPYSGNAKLPHAACPETGYVPPKRNRPGFFVYKKDEE